MSGICGMWDLSGATLPPDPLAPAIARLRRRGPDGSDAWQEGAVALGHTSLVTTPEATLERLPLRHAETGCVITADARLDNRAELLTALALACAGQTIGDGALILRAYLRWGEDCVDHLLGDFAFAIWDPRRQALFCARDQAGMRQLIYTHRPGALFAFATDARALVAMDGVPARVNEARLLDFIDEDPEGVDTEVTFFEKVFRLPPAHVVTVDASGLKRRRYWRLEPGPRLTLPSDEAYAEAFIDVFTEAVQCRLRSPETPGSMLSGGMDSGSVSAIAADLLAEQGRGPLPTFSGTDLNLGRLETRLIEEAMSLPGRRPTAIRRDDIEPLLPGLIAWLNDLEDPFDGTMPMLAGIYAKASQAGIKVMLDGAGGDTVFSMGNLLSRAVEDRRYGDVLEFARDEALDNRRQRDFWITLMRAGWHGLVPAALRRRYTAHKTRIAERRHIANSIAAKSLIQKHDLAARRAKTMANMSPDGLGLDEYRARMITQVYQIVGRERYDRIAGAHGIEPRDPFADIRVMAFSLSLPTSQLRRNGHRKYVMRRAMAGRLPDSIRWNRVPDHHGYDFTKAFFHSAPGLQHGSFICAEKARNLFEEGIESRIFQSDGSLDLAIWKQLVLVDKWIKSVGRGV